MLFLLRGSRNPAVRALVGAALVVAGIVIHGGAILIALGAVLIVWGGAQTLRKQRIGRADRVARDGRTP
jgi:predicted phage tail protein